MSTLDWSIIAPALIAGLLVLATHIPLGQQVLSRNIIFIDIAIAQVATFGLLLTDWFGIEPTEWQAQGIAMLAALSAAFCIQYLEQYVRQAQEALIGAIYIITASACLLLIAHHPHSSDHLRQLLDGQILWVKWRDLPPVALITGVVLLLKAQTASSRMFYVLFALAVTTSVQLVGIYLVFSSLIIPALAVLSWPPKYRLMGAYGMGGVAYMAGILISMILDMPTGSTIVLALGVMAVLVNVRRFYAILSTH